MERLTKRQKTVLRRVKEIEEVAPYQQRCLAAGVCPECGGDLVLKRKSVYACIRDSKCAFYGHFLS